MPYTPRPQNQNGNWPARLPKRYPYPHYDCWVRVASWTIDGATEGKMILSPWAIRELAGTYSGNPAVDGPGGAEDVERAIRAAGIPYDARTMPVDEARRILSTRTPGQFLWLATDFASWPDNKRCGSDFRGRHAVGAIPGVTPRGKVKVMNPLCNVYRFVPLEAVLASMVRYGRDHGFRDGTVYLGALKHPKAPPAPAPVPVGRVYALPSTGASLRHAPRETGNLLAVVPCGGRLRVAGPSGAGAAAAGARSPRWLEVTNLGSHSLRPSAWVKTSDVSQSRPTPPTNGTQS